MRRGGDGDALEVVPVGEEEGHAAGQVDVRPQVQNLRRTQRPQVDRPHLVAVRRSPQPGPQPHQVVGWDCGRERGVGVSFAYYGKLG